MKGRDEGLNEGLRTKRLNGREGAPEVNEILNRHRVRAAAAGLSPPAFDDFGAAPYRPRREDDYGTS